MHILDYFDSYYEACDTAPLSICDLDKVLSFGDDSYGLLDYLLDDNWACFG